MNKYSPRLTAPSATNKNYIHYTHGGYNYCIKRNGNSCLPNCVGYAWGRWREILGKKPKLSMANAENWYGYTQDGYKRGQTPKVGAVICWRKGKAGVSSDGAGHVAIVERVEEDGTIVTSNSNYSGTRWYLKEFKPPYKLGSSYTFQGFIYLPTTEKDVDKTLNVGDKVKMADNAVYFNGKSIPAWVKATTLYVRGFRTDGYVTVSTQKTGAITGAIDKKYLIKK